MSLASATGQVIFSQKGGVYMPAIQCNQGDLYVICKFSCAFF